MFKQISYLLAAILCGALFLGSIYTWIDEDGTKHYSNVTLPPGISVEEIKESNTIFEKINTRQNHGQLFQVLKIYDGDTIQVKGMGLVFKIRLVGIDAPEIGYRGQKSQPFCKKSKSYLSFLVADQSVSLKSYGIGGYNRQLAEVFVGDKNINLEMIKAGLAEVYKGKRPKTLGSKMYLDAEAAAKKNRTGMWVQTSSYISPKQWRKRHPRK